MNPSNVPRDLCSEAAGAVMASEISCDTHKFELSYIHEYPILSNHLTRQYLIHFGLELYLSYQSQMPVKSSRLKSVGAMHALGAGSSYFKV